VSAVVCKFPDCEDLALLDVGPAGEESVALCAEHRQLLLDDPGEFRRQWGAFDPRSQA
jgi:hypothetical protein